MNYDAVLDDEMRAFLARSAEFYPADATGLTMAEQRSVYEALCRDFMQPRPAGVESEDKDADGVPVRVYSAGHPTRTVMYFHGGGFVLGGLNSHDDICAELCAQTGYRIVSVDYRLCPEHLHPAQFQDCWTGTQWAAHTFGDPLVLCGDSAGGNLSACIAHHARGRLQGVIGQVLIYPWLGHVGDAGSFVEHAAAPGLTRDDLLFYHAVRFAGAEIEPDPTFAPLDDTDYSELPPTIVFTADLDPLRDEGPTYRDRLVAAGGQAEWINEPGMIHGYLRARSCAGAARNAFERISVAVEALGQDIWPYG